MTTQFSVDLVQMNGQTVIRFIGELDVTAVEQAQGAARRAFRNGYTGPVVVDVGELSFCDSTGVRVLLSIEGLAAQRGRDMVLRRPGSALLRVLGALGMDSYFPIEAVPITQQMNRRSTSR